ncbi:unnamed protein product [Ceratitis capitata]|uniref:(Mediterranean fruit fly) hypothetical protein n=1 Tax=Ceratitis capitata TaxID=7213 RepID=A0A811VID8_CERCA|nr:unnamed protein product [Ceratitis capitata]
MSQTTDAKDTPPPKPKRTKQAKDVKNNQPELETIKPRGWKSYLVSDLCIQITAWLLFTLGLCIIASTVYVGILVQLKDNQIYDDDSNLNNTNNNTTQSTTVTRESTTEALNKSVRALLLTTSEFPENRRGCREYECKVTCRNASRLYEMLYATYEDSRCSTIDVLLIINQSFPNGHLRNSWIAEKRPVNELIISSSNVTRIRSGAFNSPLFVDTYFMSLNNLQLRQVGSGSLLGLGSLRYLIIDTPLREINRAFFQPVQSTLIHVRLNCGLLVLPGTTIFGVSKLNKLEYADLSHNVFNGSLTREMLASTPNLRYLHITNSKITAIEEDAFADLTGKLQVLDLSENFISTISSKVLWPLLNSLKPTLVGLSYNQWNCECTLQEFAAVYRQFRRQFIGSIFCRTPVSLHGQELHELNFQHDNCLVTTTELEETSWEDDAINTTISNKPDVTTVATTRLTTAKVLSTTKKTKKTTTAKTTIQKPLTTGTTKTPIKTLEPTTTAGTALLVTTYAPNKTGGRPSPGEDVDSRSSIEVSDIIQMRCLYTLTNRTTQTEPVSRDKRAFDIEMISIESEDAVESASEQSNSSEESVERDNGLINPLSTLEETILTPQLQDTTTSENTISTSTTYSMYTYNRNLHKPVMTYKFELPTYTFQLALLPNNSVQVLITDYNAQPEINVIWFSKQYEKSTDENNGKAAQNIDYQCQIYVQPYMLVHNLSENNTYTFCMLELPESTISPFNCLPLHVPAKHRETDNTWISEDDKQFTLSMLCLIFILSALFGGIIAYFGVKTYPEFLEGSKNVLVVKSSEQESDYLRSTGSIKKEPLSRRSTRKLTVSTSETPPMCLPPPPPFSVSNYNLERLSSVKSSSTLFDSPFAPPPPFSAIDDQYELPKQYKPVNGDDRCVSNPYAMSPCSPPPLPKRNPSITSTFVANRFPKVD